MPKRFTIGEAESLLPRISEFLREAIILKTGYQEAEQAFATMTRRITSMGGMALDRRRAAQMRLNRDRTAQSLKKTIEILEETGCVVKDLDIGLVDFPTLFRGREVYLCWKLGEPAIAFWHETSEGFAGRRSIDPEFLSEHQGDTPS
ncbi:MAG TPA: DUF2203 domain-containing protein [Bryobacteraceae bacterium]|nr:DUF2203 domain-containing protein [Bryobacteraceae bacterium]